MQPSLSRSIDLSRFRHLPLAGDASTRRFFRLVPRNGEEPTLVLMQFEKGEGEKGVRGFVDATRLFEMSQCPVPKILSASTAEGCIVLEDLGDATLEIVAEAAEFPLHLYEEAVDVLIRLHSRSGLYRRRFPEIFSRRMDGARIRMELDFLRRHGLESSRPLSAVEEKAFDLGVAELTARIAPFSATLNHRDYHSRNIMATARGIVLVDFQDALLAPPFYDLASLLRDSYLAVPPQVSEALMLLYIGEARKAGIPLPQSECEARRLFDLVALERNLKALGTFSYHGLVLGRERYLAGIPLTLKHVRANREADSPILAPVTEIVECALGEVS